MIKKYQLPNKLRVILVESKKSPVVTIQMWVRTGSADEKKQEEGISHFIEHLVFKGTQSYGVGEIASVVEASGGELNAYTSFDQTVFHVTLSREHIPTGLKVIREMMGSPTFDSNEIDKEREVVCEEIKRSLDSPHRESSRLMFSNAFQKHPYGIPVIGYPKTVRGVSKKKIISYFQSRYVPENMTLLIAGDIDEKSLRGMVKDVYGDMKSFRLKKILRKSEPKQSKPRIATQASDFQESHLTLSWKGPGPGHKDIPALEVLGLILGQGESSRLVQAARIKKHVANSIGSGVYILKDCSMLLISSSFSDENLEELLELTKVELKRIIEDGPTKEELNKAIVNFEAEEFFSLETVDGLARKIGHFDDLLHDPYYFKKFMTNVRKVTTRQVAEIAKKYFDPKKINISFLGKRSGKSSQKTLNAFAKNLSLELVKVKPKVKASKSQMKPIKWTGKLGDKAVAEKFVLENGLTVLHRISRDTPTVSVRLGALGGLRAEAYDKQGSLELLSNTWTASTKNLSEEEIQKQVEGMAASIHSFGGRNSIGISLEVLKPFEQQAAELLEELTAFPTFPDVIVEREKAALLEQLKARKDNPGQVCIQQFYANIFKGNPYEKDLAGVPEQVKGVSRNDIRSLWEKSIGSNNLKVAIAGDADLSLWKNVFKNLGRDIPAGKKFDKKFPPLPIDSSQVYFTEMDKEQTHIVVGHRGLTLDDPDRFALQLIQSVLAGQGGRLFIELRDKNSLAYTVSPMRMEGIDTGHFGAYIACSPEKAQKSIEMLRIEFQKIAAEFVEDVELERSKNYLIGRHDIDLQRNSAISSSLLFDDLYDLDFEEMYKFPEYIRAVSKEDLRRVAAKILGQPEIISIAGKTNPESL